jgi:hypothetical protein
MFDAAERRSSGREAGISSRPIILKPGSCRVKGRMRAVLLALLILAAGVTLVATAPEGQACVIYFSDATGSIVTCVEDAASNAAGDLPPP